MYYAKYNCPGGGDDRNAQYVHLDRPEKLLLLYVYFQGAKVGCFGEAGTGEEKENMISYELINFKHELFPVNHRQCLFFLK